MRLTDAPVKISEAWAQGGDFNVIPIPSQIPITPGAASFTTGFPPLTMTDPVAGGIGPSGLDMNGLGNALSVIDRWMCAGAGFLFDSSFATAIGGYPKGARVLAASGNGYWLSMADNNSNNPDTGGAGWTLQGASASSSVYASTQQTLVSGNQKILFNSVEFDEGLWDATNHRFLAPFSGKFRVNGAVLLNAPTGALYATEIWHNGAFAKQCFQAPQLSNVDLIMPFDAIINCASGDYIEIFLGNPATSVLVGAPSGSSQGYVFAQCSYVGA